MPLTSTHFTCSGWTSNTFINSDDAEIALCDDRHQFVTQHGLVTHLPTDIWRQIFHSDPSARITGFEQLFTLLNTDPGADGLRQLVVDYFNNSLYLRMHLREQDLSHHIVYAIHSLLPVQDTRVILRSPFPRPMQITKVSFILESSTRLNLHFLGENLETDTIMGPYARNDIVCWPVSHRSLLLTNIS